MVKNANHFLSLNGVIIFLLTGRSCLDVDGCWLIRVVDAESWGACGNFQKWDNTETCHICWLFLSLEYLQVILELLISLIAILLSHGIGKPEETRKQQAGGAVRTHTTLMKFTELFGQSSWSSKTIKTVTAKITTTSTIIKNKNIVRRSKCDTETQREQRLLEEIPLTDFARCRVAVNFPFIINSVSVKCNKAKHNRVKCAGTLRPQIRTLLFPAVLVDSGCPKRITTVWVTL